MSIDVRPQTVRLFQTLPHDCGYFADRTAQNLVIDPAAPNMAQVYDNALTRGYRRAGNHVYMPHCAACHACTPVRVPVATFQPDRSQRRCLASNNDVQIAITKAGYSDERFALYQRYLSSRHTGGGMDDATRDDFEKFLYTDWSPTCFIEFRLDDVLIAVAVTDSCSNGLSAVYSWFDPGLRNRSLGTLAILSQIKLASANNLDHLYLGYWIAGHPKMDYKARYRPLEALRGGVWQPLQGRDALINPAQASPLCLPADRGALAKIDWTSVETAQRGDAGRQSGPSLLISNDGVMSERSSD